MIAMTESAVSTAIHAVADNVDEFAALKHDTFAAQWHASRVPQHVAEIRTINEKLRSLARAANTRHVAISEFDSIMTELTAAGCTDSPPEMLAAVRDAIRNAAR